MIYYVKGEFVLKSATQVVVDCAGVGYDVQISLNTYADIEPLSNGLLYTYHLVREDAQQLFGFSTQREKALFELLISVSGVGANTARVILSSLAPHEVEQAIMQHDAVSECAVIGESDDDRGMIVKGFIVLKSGVKANDDLTKDIQQFVKNIAAPYKYPRAIEYIAALPKSATGKLLRKELKS